MIYYRTVVTEVGENVGDLLDEGVLILYAHGAPAALAEVSVLHKVQDEAFGHVPTVGSIIQLGDLQTRVTAIGASAWHKVKELGHVVISFNASATADRPGEMCVERLNLDLVKAAMISGCVVLVKD